MFKLVNNIFDLRSSRFIIENQLNLEKKNKNQNYQNSC